MFDGRDRSKIPFRFIIIRHERNIIIITVVMTLIFIILVCHTEDTNNVTSGGRMRSIINQKVIVCGKDEVLSHCVQNECKIQMCTEREIIIEEACDGRLDLTCEEIIHRPLNNCSNVPLHQCREGCVCRKLYLRDLLNTCIPELKCI